LSFEIAFADSGKASVTEMASPNFMTQLIFRTEILGVPKMLVQRLLTQFNGRRLWNETTSTSTSSSYSSCTSLIRVWCSCCCSSMAFDKRRLDVSCGRWRWKWPLEETEWRWRSGGCIARKRTSCQMTRWWRRTKP
jgi:hypothetical protein